MVIILRAVNGNLEKNIGVAVDSISGVLSAAGEDIQMAPDFGARLNTDIISGLATDEGKMVMLLDVDKLLCFSHADAKAENNSSQALFESK